MRRLLVIVLALSSYSLASAAAVYITRDGAGSKNGTTLGNAGACDATANTPQSTCAYFNNSANWGSGSTQIGAGTAVHLGDDAVTITATAGASSYLQFQAGGSSGSVIELLINTTLSAPYWCCQLGNGAIDLAGHSYVLVDGGTPCGWNVATNASEGSCVGSIIATANGDGLTYQQESTAISSNSCNNVEIRNLGIYNIYVKSNPAVGGPSNSLDIYCNGNSSTFSIHDNAIHDEQTAFGVVPSSGTNSGWLVYNNDLYHMNWGIVVAAGGSSTISGFHITGNHLHDMDNWDTNSGSYHHDGIYPFGNANTNTLADFEVVNNIFDGKCQATGLPGCTSWLFMDASDQCTSCYFVNNVVLQTTAPSGTSTGDPLFNLGMNGGVANVYNNTFVCSTTNGNPGGFELDQHAGSTSANVFNNLVVNCGRFTNLAAHPATHSPPTTGYDYNVYATASNGNMWDPPQGCCDATLSAWQGHLASYAASSDTNAVYASGSAGLGGSYENGAQSPLSGLVPQSGSVAKGAGTNLTSLCSTISALCSDITGNARPSGATAWDAGALNFGSGGSTYTITISSITGNGTVTSSDSVLNCTTGTTGTCSDATATGTVTLTETPSGGYTFTSWGGGTCSGSASTCNVTGAATVTATFTAIPTQYMRSPCPACGVAENWPGESMF